MYIYLNFIFLPINVPVAHEDSIWTVSWGTSDKDGTENIVTGAVDDMVKCWRWLVLQGKLIPQGSHFHSLLNFFSALQCNETALI